MKKRAVAIILAAVILVGLLGACKKESQAPTDCVTRGEWLSMLVDGFDLDHVTGSTPYFEDIHEGSPCFKAVQTAGAWNILAPFSGNKLNADQPITREEAAATAAIAAGFRVDEDFEAEQAVAFAADRGILLLDGQKYVTPSEGETALEAAKEVYLSDPGEERMTVVLNPNLIDLRELAPAEMPSEDGQVLYPFGVGSLSTDASGQTVASLPWGGEQIALQVGDTFIAPPTEEFPAGVAYKVTAIYDTDGAVTLDVQQPALEDLYETLDVHTTVSADLDNIIWTEGLSVTGEGGDYTISLLSSEKKNTPLLDKSFTFQKGDYQKNWTKQNSAHLGSSAEATAFNESNFVYTDTPSLNDFGGGTAAWEKKLLTENKFSAGYKITGKLTIQDIAIIPDIHLFSNASASIAIKADMNASLKLEGNLSERPKIASIPIAVTPLGVTVTVDIYLYVDASGSIQTEAKFGYNSKVEWKNGAGLRKSQNCTMNTTSGIEADIGFGGDLAATAYAFGLNVIDAGAKAGGEITAEAKVVGKYDQTSTDGLTTQTYKESMKVNATLYAPIVTLYVGSKDSFIKKQFGVGGEWKLLTKENTWSKPLLNQEWVFWEQTVTLDEDGNIIDEVLASASQGFDFSEFAGEYKADAIYVDFYGGMEVPDLTLHADGSVSGATGFDPTWDSTFSENQPISIQVEDSGVIRCVLWETPPAADHGWLRESYEIYPVGVSAGLMGDDDTSKVRIHYEYAAGGVWDMFYTKVD